MAQIHPYKRDFIHFMVRAGALTFGDFVTKSGRKTPYFINTGKYNTGEQAALLGQYYADAFKQRQADGDLSMGVNCLFGPAYKGIPLSVGMAIALETRYRTSLHYCFDRKEEKDHGEGGSLVGYKPGPNDEVVIIEDVITAGTAIRQVMPIFQSLNAPVKGVFVSVDRMERGQGELTAIDEIRRDFGLSVFPIVTIREVLSVLYNQPVDGKIYIDNDIRARMEDYWAQYCVIP